jgi:hypothetical protein
MTGDTMTEEQQQWIELGRRAVACAGWRWVPGMRALRLPPLCIGGAPYGWAPDRAELWIKLFEPDDDDEGDYARGGHVIAQIGHGIPQLWDCPGNIDPMEFWWESTAADGEGAWRLDRGLDLRDRGGHDEEDHREVVPDLRDPGTQGCVLALVREAMRDPAFALKRVCIEGDWHGEKGQCISSSHRKPWAWESFKHGYSANRKGFDTEAEALVDALERAQLLEAAP